MSTISSESEEKKYYLNRRRDATQCNHIDECYQKSLESMKCHVSWKMSRTALSISE